MWFFSTGLCFPITIVIAGIVAYFIAFIINKAIWKAKNIKCPKCQSDNLGKEKEVLENKNTEHGYEITYKETYICKDCGHHFGEKTFMEGKDYRNDTRYGKHFGLDTPNTVFGISGLAAIAVAIIVIFIIIGISFSGLIW